MKVDLPAGTSATGHSHGQLRIGSEMFGIDADRPGPHPSNELPDNPRGGNLERLFELVDRMTLGLPFRGIGLPSVVVVHGLRPQHVLQWAPFAPAGDVVLQHNIHGNGVVRFCSLAPDKVRAQAERIVDEMYTLWGNHRAIGRRARVARAAGHAIARRHEGVQFPAVAIDLSNQHFENAYDVMLNLDAWDDALRPAILYSLINRDDQPEDHDGPDLSALAITLSRSRIVARRASQSPCA